MKILGSPTKKTIKSIQKGKVIIGVGSTSVNVAIANVDLSKAVVIINEGTDQNPAINTCKVLGYLSSSINLNVSTHYAIQAATVETVYWQVIEFKDVKSVQKGYNAYSAHANNLAIASIDPSKSLLFCSHKTDGTNQCDGIFGLGITSPTNIEIKKGGFGNATLQWYVVEQK